jgi:hypothetical protein
MGGTSSGRMTAPARRRKAEALRERGLSIVEIGRRLGISHEGVSYILRRSGPGVTLPAMRCRACRAAVARRPDGRG